MLARLRRNPRRFVLKLAPRGSVCAELGVWQGDFAAEILRVVRPSKLHLIDPWTFMSEDAYSDARYGGKVAPDQAAMDRLHESVLARFAGQIANGTVEVHRCGSQEASARFADGSFDWVYVDGNHLYEFVRADLELYDPKLRAGGVLAGDDYGEPGWWHDGVTRAVDEFVAAGRYDVVSFAASQFVLRKRGVSRS